MYSDTTDYMFIKQSGPCSNVLGFSDSYICLSSIEVEVSLKFFFLLEVLFFSAIRQLLPTTFSVVVVAVFAVKIKCKLTMYEHTTS